MPVGELIISKYEMEGKRKGTKVVGGSRDTEQGRPVNIEIVCHP